MGARLPPGIGCEAAQDALHSAGLRATVITVAGDPAGDQRVRDALRADTYDAVSLGVGLSGQAPPKYGATAESTMWFNRVLNIVNAEAPTAKIVLARGPGDVMPAIERGLERLTQTSLPNSPGPRWPVPDWAA